MNDIYSELQFIAEKSTNLVNLIRELKYKKQFLNKEEQKIYDKINISSTEVNVYLVLLSNKHYSDK